MFLLLDESSAIRRESTSFATPGPLSGVDCWLCHFLACDLEQLASFLWASVFSLVKWDERAAIFWVVWKGFEHKALAKFCARLPEGGSMENITSSPGSTAGEGHPLFPREHLLSLWKDIWLQGHLREHRYTQGTLPDSSVLPLSLLAPGECLTSHGPRQSGWI